MSGSHSLVIRRLEAPDVHSVLTIIAEVRREYGLDGRVPLLEGPDYALNETYRNRRSAYFVATVDAQVVGGAGVSRLRNGDVLTCELQRMYLQKASRRLGMGQGLLDHCLAAARQFGYQRCYAETISEMGAALAFYERHGFERLDAPLGDTGHSHNDRWLLLQLVQAAHAVNVSL